jgi:hypothetical protein
MTGAVQCHVSPTGLGPWVCVVGCLFSLCKRLARAVPPACVKAGDSVTLLDECSMWAQDARLETSCTLYWHATGDLRMVKSRVNRRPMQVYNQCACEQAACRRTAVCEALPIVVATVAYMFEHTCRSYTVITREVVWRLFVTGGGGSVSCCVGSLVHKV